MVFSLCHYIWDFCLRISLLLKGAGAIFSQILEKRTKYGEIPWKNGQKYLILPWKNGQSYDYTKDWHGANMQVCSQIPRPNRIRINIVSSMNNEPHSPTVSMLCFSAARLKAIGVIPVERVK